MNKTQLRFRPMALSDVNRVMLIEQAVYPYPWTTTIFNDCIRVGYHCWLALSGAELVGHAVISIAAGESHLLNVSIGKPYQRRGFGRELVEFLIEDARDHQAETMLLEVRPSNLSAIACYQAAGFNEVGCRKGYYPADNGREDALLFAYHIASHADALTHH